MQTIFKMKKLFLMGLMLLSIGAYAQISGKVVEVGTSD
jgi:hypothetical protein